MFFYININNSEHECYYNVLTDDLVCVPCKRKICNFVERISGAESMDNSADSDSDSLSVGSSEQGRLPPSFYRNSVLLLLSGNNCVDLLYRRE